MQDTTEIASGDVSRRDNKIGKNDVATFPGAKELVVRSRHGLAPLISGNAKKSTLEFERQRWHQNWSCEPEERPGRCGWPTCPLDRSLSRIEKPGPKPKIRGDVETSVARAKIKMRSVSDLHVPRVDLAHSVVVPILVKMIDIYNYL